MMVLENRIYAKVKAIVDAFISAKNLKGWKCIQGEQHTILENINKTIRFYFISTVQNGWQGREYKTDEEGNTIRIDRYREKRKIQFNINRIDDENDKIDTITSTDVASMMRVWLMSNDGLVTMRNEGFFPLRVTNLRIGNIVKEDYTYTHFSGFDITLIYEQSIETNVDSTEDISGDVEAIQTKVEEDTEDEKQYEPKIGRGIYGT